MTALPPGVTGSSRLVLNAGQVDFLRALRANVPPSIPLYVTSATRTPEAQARALVEKRKLGDNLYKLYRAKNIVKAVLAVPNTIAAMAPIIARFAQQGQFMSRHMRGDAIDLRNRNLSPQQQDVVTAAGRRLGARVIVETKPPHIHMEAIGGTVSDIILAAQERVGRIKGSTTLTVRHRRRLKRLYKKQKVIYTVTALGAATALVLLLVLRGKNTKGIEAEHAKPPR